MKKILFSLLLVAGFSFASQAQRYAIIDTRYILDKMQEYKDAQKTLDATAQMWQKEIDNKQDQLNKMYRDLKLKK